MNKLYNVFKIRLMLLSMAALVAIIVVIHATVYLTIKRKIEEQLVMSTKGIVVSIADAIMKDIDGYKLFLKTRDVNSEYYKNMRTYFAHIKENSNIKYIYTERRLDEEKIEFILDAEPIDKPDYSPPGSTEANDQLKEITYSTGNLSAFGVVEHEKWGKLLGAYAPIFDTDGNMLGITGVNIDASVLSAQLNNMTSILLVIYAVIICSSFVSLLKYSETILEPLLKDKLTGAYSKRYFERFLHKEIRRTIEQREEMTLMVLDLDHFKVINDTYGHVFGDKVLSATSEIIKKTLRPGDSLIRYGGEEFIAVTISASAKHALEIARRIRKAVEDNEIFNEEMDIPIKITISIGVSGLNNLLTNPKELISNADEALYNAKVKRNMVSLFKGAV